MCEVSETLNSFTVSTKDLSSVLKEVAQALGYPLFVKPISLGSSIGVSRVEDYSQLIPAIQEAFKYDDTLLIEKGIDTWYALETYELTLLRKFEVVVLITGDADHEMIARKLKALKSRVLLLTWNMSEASSSTSRYLKEEANWHIELSEECAKDKMLIDKLCEKI